MKAKKSKNSFNDFHLAKFLSSNKKVKILISILFIAVIAVNMGELLFRGSDKYFSTDYWDRYPSLKSTYYNSVYANKKGNFPRDEFLYAFNGGALISGVSPILVNPEVPPTGKYIVGLSILLFKNEHLMTYLFGLGALFLMFMVGRQIFKSDLVSLIAPTLITFEPFFKNQFVYTPLFDIFQLVFLLAAFYFFNKGFMGKRKTYFWFLLSCISIGLFISTKFFGTGITIVAAMISVLLLHKEFKKTFILLLMLPISLLILLLSYIRVLMIGYPFLKFLGIQKWVLWYNQGHLQNQFTIWLLLFFNKWVQSNGRVSSDPQWLLTWPVSTLISGFTILSYSLRRSLKNKAVEVLMAWSVFYLIILSLSDASARYFVILLPVLFIISVWGITRIYRHLVK